MAESTMNSTARTTEETINDRSELEYTVVGTDGVLNTGAIRKNPPGKTRRACGG